MLRRLAGSGWDADAKTLQIAFLSLVCYTSEYCAPVWCSSVYTFLIGSVLDYAMRIVTGCLRPTPTDYLPILAVTQPAEFRWQGATLFLKYLSIMDPKHLLHQLMFWPTMPTERLQSCHQPLCACGTRAAQ